MFHVFMENFSPSHFCECLYLSYIYIYIYIYNIKRQTQMRKVCKKKMLNATAAEQVNNQKKYNYEHEIHYFRFHMVCTMIRCKSFFFF